MTTEEPSTGERKVSTKMAWLFLLAAGCVEVAWALSIEPTKGFTRFWPTVLCLVLGVSAVYLLTFALRTLPIGTAYAVSPKPSLSGSASTSSPYSVTSAALICRLSRP